MIFQFNEQGGHGMIMLTNGDTKEFSLRDWVDKGSEPAVGKKIAYILEGPQVQIREASKEDEIASKKPQEPEIIEEAVQNAIGDFDAHIAHFTAQEFKLVKDVQDAGVRVATLRLYTPYDYGEVTLKQEGSELSVSQTMNGKTVYNS